MKEIPKFKSRKKWGEAIWQEFLENIEKSDSGNKTATLLNNLLGANEKRIISKRLAALALIKKGKTYQEIGEILWISPSTVSAIKKSVHKNIGYQSNRYYAGISKNKKRKNVKALPPQTVFDYWLNFPLPGKTGRGRWKFLNYQG